ncbi:MAG TPA: hypothetical protein VMA83_04565 [Solirubrobacteraceae bacterium]|nr:hypothetical protein [Solirubrobacteraceae bacterium]
MLDASEHSNARAGVRNARRAGRPGERGDTLVEVLISAMLLGIIVIGTFSGLDALNRSTTLERDRSQADALAQQEQEVLRSEPVSKLNELNRERTVSENGTSFTIKTTAGYISDKLATTSCSEPAGEEADEIKTVSSVTWHSMGVTKPVVETSLISPPPGTLLVIQVTGPVEKVKGAKVAITGPTSVSTETSEKGCSLIQIQPGEYAINVSKTGYVDQNGFLNTDEDVADTRLDYLTAGSSERIGYQLAPASKLSVKFSGTGTEEGDTFVAFNTGQNGIRAFGTAGTYGTTVTTAATMYPFATPYTVYAGTCEADLPTLSGAESNPQVVVPEGGTGEVTVPVVPVSVKVYSGTSSGTPGSLISGARVKITDEGCATTRTFSTNASGSIGVRGLPFGKFTLCASTTSGTKKKWTGTLKDESSSGATWVPNGGFSGAAGVIYLGTSPSGSPSGVVAGEC